MDHLFLGATTLDASGQEQMNQAVAVSQGQISWCGPMISLPARYQQEAKMIHTCEGRLLTPAFIDCHTHLVYAGNRADEFKRRLEGATYADIARAGGGILSTVNKTRACSPEQLLEQSLPRLLALQSEGVLSVEIKSGYGLDLDNELKMLRVARQLGDITGVRVMTTFLGAHAIPPEFAGRSQVYVDYLCETVIPAAVEERLADAMDVFCETIAFSLSQTEQLFATAQSYRLPIKCHAEQLSNMGCTVLASKYNALSSDHIEYLDEMGVDAMAKANMVAVLLPGAFYYLKEQKKPPIEHLRQAAVGIAVATDCNPGTSPTTSLRLMMNMACQFFGLTIPEVLSAVTYQAARALGIDHLTGEIKAGKAADLLLWPFSDSAQLAYSFGYPLKPRAMQKGKWVVLNPSIALGNP